MRKGRAAAILAGLALAVAACGNAPTTSQPSDAPAATEDGGAKTLEGVTLEVAAKWTGEEQKNFEQVLKAFSDKTGAKVTYASTGEDTGAYLGPRIQGGSPPDVAILPQPGLVQQYAQQGALKPLTEDVTKEIDANYTDYWKELGSADGQVYGVLIKAAHKSLVWYRADAFEEAGVQPPTTWDELVTAAQTIADSGTAPFSFCGASGWTLTDLFENVYLSTAGPEKYDQLSKHEIKYTDPTVKEALRKLAEIWGKDSYLAGGAKGALQTEFPASVPAVFGDEPKAAMLPGADFVASEITSATNSKVGTDADFFPFPAAGSTTPVVGAGDVAVMMKDTPAARELMKFLATPEAAKVWAEQGGFISPNKALDLSVYPDEVQRRIAKAVIDAGDAFRFDMSDLAPAAFGGTKGSGEWKILQDFLADPDDVDGTAEKLEKAAAAAFKS